MCRYPLGSGGNRVITLPPKRPPALCSRMMSRMKLLGFSRGSSLISVRGKQGPRRFPVSRGRAGEGREGSAARIGGDGEAERARGGVVLEIVAGALEPGWRGEQADDRRFVGRKLALLGLIVPDEPLHRRQGGLIGGELGACE